MKLERIVAVCALAFSLESCSASTPSEHPENLPLAAENPALSPQSQYNSIYSDLQRDWYDFHNNPSDAVKARVNRSFFKLAKLYHNLQLDGDLLSYSLSDGDILSLYNSQSPAWNKDVCIFTQKKAELRTSPKKDTNMQLYSTYPISKNN